MFPPLGEEHINHILIRTKRELRTLHCVSANGKFYCLDLSLSAPTKQELDAKMVELLNSLEHHDVLPGAPRSDWLQLVPHKMRFVRRYCLPVMLAPPIKLGVVLMTGSFRESW